MSFGCELIGHLFPLPSFFGSSIAHVLFAALTSFLLVVLFGGAVIRRLQRMRALQPLRTFSGFFLAELHKPKQDTPTMGGILILAAVIVSSVLWADARSLFLWLLMGSFVLFGGVGLIDDWAKLRRKSWRGVPGIVRLLVQTAWACFVIVVFSHPSLSLWVGLQVPTIMEQGSVVDWNEWMTKIYIPFVQHPYICSGAAIGVVWFLQWLTIVGSANAVNLTDGLDGLAAGCSTLIAATLVIFALMSQQADIAICLSALVGGCLGFLWFNGYPAQVFMGDTGSLAIGGLLGTSAVFLKREWLLALIGAVLVAETLSVIIQVISFRIWGVRVFRCTPLHHHFEYAGIPESRVVVRLWIVTIFLCLAGLTSILR
jgi:phospho-N-acetylmuramoyl-pentapeptide-transferase